MSDTPRTDALPESIKFDDWWAKQIDAGTSTSLRFAAWNGWLARAEKAERDLARLTEENEALRKRLHLHHEQFRYAYCNVCETQLVPIGS